VVVQNAHIGINAHFIVQQLHKRRLLACLAVALALSFMEKSLLVVAIGTCIGSLAVSVLLMYI
jgi:hypothetical protein